jgi:hypothetical protein
MAPLVVDFLHDIAALHSGLAASLTQDHAQDMANISWTPQSLTRKKWEAPAILYIIIKYV